MIKVAVLGAGGKMGIEVLRSVSADKDLELVAAVDPKLQGIDVRQVAGIECQGLEFLSDIESLEDAMPDVAVDFTNAKAAIKNIKFLISNSIHGVIGTSGISENEIAEVKKLMMDDNSNVSPKLPANIVMVSNFAIGAVLMMHFAEIAAKFFDHVEIIEEHHDQKIDAPSATAITTANRIMLARSNSEAVSFLNDKTVHHTLEGSRGAKGPGGIPIHSVRMRGLVAHQEVLFGTDGQTLSIRHDSMSRASFMPGVILAIKKINEIKGLTVGLDKLLGL